MFTRLLPLLALMLLLAACESTPGTVDTGDKIPAEADKAEQVALARIGDVRVFYYQKAGLKPSAMHPGKNVEQKRQLHILVNKGHSFYEGQPDYTMKSEERYLYSVDMHDLLVILRDQMGFFEKGASINIKGDDPVRRADREDTTDRMIAVEQIKDGKVNTSYFPRRVLEETLDADRSEKFNNCQSMVLTAIARAEPRGSTGDDFNRGKALRGQGR